MISKQKHSLFKVFVRQIKKRLAAHHACVVEENIGNAVLGRGKKPPASASFAGNPMISDCSQVPTSSKTFLAYFLI
jgi:hypothetical protein